VRLPKRGHEDIPFQEEPVMAIIFLIATLSFAGVHHKLDAKPCDVKTECKHPAFK
jgi:hypothetical protein